MTGPRRSSYEVVIVGGGVIGLFTAHFLSQLMDPGKILVIDRGFATGGASGRNGGGVRQQWETRATIRLARESVGVYRRFGRDFGFNPWFRQGGYLFLASTDEEVRVLRRMETGILTGMCPSCDKWCGSTSSGPVARTCSSPSETMWTGPLGMSRMAPS